MRLAAFIVLAFVFPAVALADGLPVVNIDVGPSGVTSPAAPDRFVALPAGRNTLVARIDRRGGRVRASRVLPGHLTIPAVAYDASADGLSGDGLSLVLLVPRTTFPRASTTFAIVETGPLREPGEAMNGLPLTRATSPDGRWAYTLYDGTEHPFVHALDTAGRSARCIDLDWLHGRQDLWRMRFAMSADGRELSVRSGNKTVALVDTRTFAATTGGEADTEDRSPWIFVALGIGLLLTASGGLYVVGSRRRAAATSFGGATSA